MYVGVVRSVSIVRNVGFVGFVGLVCVGVGVGGVVSAAVGFGFLCAPGRIYVRSHDRAADHVYLLYSTYDHISCTDRQCTITCTVIRITSYVCVDTCFKYQDLITVFS
jgi:hypothetical protein